MPFEEFWAAWPIKRHKKEAERLYKAALKRAKHKKIMLGLEQYKKNKPPWQQWALASTWLRNDRWEDVWETPPEDRLPAKSSYPRAPEPPRLTEEEQAQVELRRAFHQELERARIDPVQMMMHNPDGYRQRYDEFKKSRKGPLG